MHQARPSSTFSRALSRLRAWVLPRWMLPLPWCFVMALVVCSPVMSAVAAGSGAVIAWGDQGMGQSDAPPAAGAAVTQVAGGYLHSVALKSTGAVLAWGSNQSGQCTVPAGAASGVTQIASGLYHSMALKSDGSVLAWGYNGEGASTVPAAAKSAVTQISGGYAHSVAVKSNGSLVAWGSNSNGQTIIPSTAATGMKQASAGVFHTIALKSTGAVLAWGDNANGQCTVPSAAATGVTQVAAGYYHSLALKSNGSVIAWGSNVQGQSSVPSTANAGVTQVVGSYSNSLARKADGSVVVWGDPNTRVALLPTASRSSVTQLGAGGFHGLAVVTAPVISGVAPSSGSTLGGTTITITGTDLAGTTQVKVGGVSATGIVATATLVKAVTAASTAGLKDVAVTTAGGTATKVGAFTSVVPPPTIASVSPATGPASGGTAFTITGSNLNGASSVKVGGVAATALVISATSITGKTPAVAAGARDVSVTTAGGTVTKPGAFLSVAAPTIASVSPSSGPLGGGTAITIAGANLAGATVTVDGAAATVVTATAGSISAKTPAGTAGAKSVVVTTVGGASTKAGGFTYVAAPAIASVSPSAGPLVGGTAITITGANLNGATVTVDGKAATSVIASASSISAKVPAGAPGAKNVVVTTVGGSATKAAAFTYVPVPTIAGVSPSSGPVVGGTTITITGTNLAGATVTIDGKAATGVVASASLITATTPAGTVGAKSVAVATAGGVATRPNGFTYTSSFTGGMPVAGGDSGAPTRGTGSEHVWAGRRGVDAAGAAGAMVEAEDDAESAEAPMGVQRYLQVITIRSEGEVSCDNAPATGSSVVDATPQDAVAPIDLDQNGEADLCQLRRGDLDLNGAVDQDDVAILMQLIGSDPVLGIGDLDGDGAIDNGDAALLLTSFA
jgi:alpha-tubulin suppressor-like RCC1 family protein